MWNLKEKRKDGWHLGGKNYGSMWEIETNDDINIREEKMRMRNRNIESKTDIFVKKIVNLYEKRKARMTSISKKIINLYKK